MEQTEIISFEAFKSFYTFWEFNKAYKKKFEENNAPKQFRNSQTI